MEADKLSILNPRPVQASGPTLLHNIVQCPSDSVALEYTKQRSKITLTYRQLHNASDALAERIYSKRQNTETQFIIPVLIPQSPALYISILAILKAGGAFCPLHIETPLERVKFILNDVSAKVVLASKALATGLPTDMKAFLILVDDEDEDLFHYSPASHPLYCDVSASDSAYVMYTSGSTGSPKGVVVSHGAATQALLAHDRHIPAFSRFLQFAAPTFDVSIFEIFFPWLRGSTLVATCRENLLDDLPSVLRELMVDACELTPTVATSLLRSREAVPNLRLLMTIGEMLNSRVIQEYGGSDGRDSILWAMYGPTEAAIHCTLQSSLSGKASVGNIGRPLDTVSCFIIRPALSADQSNAFQVLPVGIEGELAVGGHQLADGYLNRPDQNDAAFIDSPYGRVYRTGDKARMNVDGTLECLGRLNSGQAKLRGQRLELGEVEQVVLRTAGCHGAVAAIIDTTLVAFCAVDEGVTEAAILTTCTSWLPRFMIPGELQLFRAFPRLPSGKADVQKLRRDYSVSSTPETCEDLLFISESAKTITSVLSNVLGVNVQILSNLASIGIDSLVAITLASTFRSSGFDISVSTILACRTVSDLQAAASSSESEDTLVEATSISLLQDIDLILDENKHLSAMRYLIEDVIPCTRLQSSMLAETARHDTAYCNEAELELIIAHPLSDVIAAIRRVAQNNEILRAGFLEHQGRFISVIFRELALEQIQIVEEFRLDFRLLTPLDYLHPLRIQIKNSELNQGIRILIHAHHAIYDGWSMDMILSDLTEVLEGNVPKERPQFRQVVAYQYEWPKLSLQHGAHTFWAEYFLGWNKVPFPTLSSELSKSHRISTTSMRFDIAPSRVLELIKDTCDSIQSVFQTTVSLVWSRILGVFDVVMGLVTSGRTIAVAGIDEIIGPCVSPVPFRIDFSQMSTYLDAILSVRSGNRAAMESSNLALSDISKAAGLQSGDNIYDVLFAYQESPESRKNNRKMVQPIRHFDRLETALLVEVEPQQHGFAVQITHHDAKFHPEFVKYFAQQMQKVFTDIIQNPHGLIESSTASIQHGLSVYEQQGQMSQPQYAGLAELFEASVTNNPSAEALRFGLKLMKGSQTLITLSYEDLNDRANQVACILRRRGIQLGQVVAVIMAKSPWLYVSILSILKVGCAYLPILPSTPVARVKQILEQAQVASCVIDDDAYKEFDMISEVDFIRFNETELTLHPRENATAVTDPKDTAYVVYTSGTTGIPKGIAVSQKNIVSNIEHLGRTYPGALNGPGRLLQACSQAFDVSVFEIFFAWHTGMSLCAAANDDLFEDFEGAINTLSITHLSLTPTVASLIDPSQVQNVEFIVTAGEPMTQSVVERWGDKLWQGYGPSETTNICSVKQMNRDQLISHLGWVFPNTSVCVLDSNTRDMLPIGWVGELCFGGDQVANGYLNMPDQTASKFIDHPQLGRMFLSGDLGRMLPDGSLVILGRLDDQVKLRGQRIECGEIDTVITNSGAAESATTILVRRENNNTELLVSFFVPRNCRSSSQHTKFNKEANRGIFAALQTKLPRHMIPLHVIPISHLPLTSSGKVDRGRLLQVFQDMSTNELEATTNVEEVTRIDEGDWTVLEHAVASAIAQVSGTASVYVGRWTPFAVLGLDSITAITASREIKKQIGLHAPISAIIQYPTVAQLCHYLESSSKAAKETRDIRNIISDACTISIQSLLRDKGQGALDILPCSPLQEAMLARGRESYYNKILFRLKVPGEKMRGYWQKVCERHDILKTCFFTTSDPAFPIIQTVLRNWNLPWKVVDTTKLTLNDAVTRHLKSVSEPLDSGSPPFSLTVFKYEDFEYLSFICHHALYDGIAMETLWREIEGLANNKELPPPISYPLFLQEAMALPEHTLEFWKRQLLDFAPSFLFPLSPTRQVVQETYKVSLDLSLTTVREKLRPMGVSLLSLCQASWANVLAASNNAFDICFGNVVNGRTVNIEGIERLVAPCFNTIPVRKNVSNTAQNIQLAKSFQDFNAQCMQYQFTPLKQIQKLFSHERRHIFDTLLLLQPPLQDMDDTIWILEEDSGSMDLPVVCEITPCPSLDCIFINIHHDKNVVSDGTAAVLADLLMHFMRTIITMPYAARTHRDELPSELRERLQIMGTQSNLTDSTNIINGTETYDDNWSELERLIQHVLSGLSEIPDTDIKRDTTIFRLGLDSINAVQVASALRREGYAVSSSQVIENPSCAKLADAILRSEANVELLSPTYDFETFRKRALSNDQAELRDSIRVEEILPCTPIQCAMINSFLQSGGKNYLNLSRFEVDDKICEEQLSRAWASLYQRHVMLRTGFVKTNHQHCTFAMVQYPADQITSPIILENDRTKNVFKFEVWKAETALYFVDNLHLPPWKVVIHRENNRRIMTLLIHHALYDAQSLDQMLSDLAKSIKANHNQKFPDIKPALGIIMSKTLDDQQHAQEFWQGLAPSTVVNSFPVMTPLRETSRVILNCQIKSSVSIGYMQKAMKDIGVSVQALLQAAWTRLLSSYIGENAVVFGVTLSGRTIRETVEAPFPCLMTLPVIASNKPSNMELLHDMMDYNSNMHKHSFTPLSKVQTFLGHPGYPIFDTLLVYQKLLTNTETRPWQLVRDEPTVEYPVSLEVEPLEDGLIQISLTYFSDILPKEQANILLQQFDAILAHFVQQPLGDSSHPYVGVEHLFAVSPAVSPEMGVTVEYLHQFVEQKAQTHPSKIALEFVSGFNGEIPIKKNWTYSELDDIGNQVAHMLGSWASVGSIVALHFEEKCPEAYFTILGILKAGCSFVALDARAPKARKEFILRDSQCPCIFVSAGSDLDFDAAATKVIRIEEGILAEYPTARRNIGSSFNSGSTCYCLYTSGTTGTPKGCEITHENAVQAMAAFEDLFHGHWDAESRWLQFAALHFDVSVLEQYWSWCVGITVVAAPKDLLLDNLTGSINRLCITHIDLTPSLARLTHPDETPSLCKGVFITGGEQLKQDILDIWGPKKVIYNAYGPTEATIGVTMYQRVPTNGRPSNIGKQFPNVGSYVFHPGTEIPVMRGAVGELCVSGKLVGKGYLNRPELTAEKFPTLQIFGEKVYRTGDLVRLLYDGCFEFLGRTDDQVKLRGQRLEIGEINHTIRSGTSGIQDAATIVCRHKSSDKNVLVCFLVSMSPCEAILQVLSDNENLGVRARSACRAKLPPYMIPTYFVRISSMPLSSNNKAEERVLKNLFRDLPQENLMKYTALTANSSFGFTNETMNSVTSVLEEFAGKGQIKVTEHTSIFDIGIDSINALQLASLFARRGFTVASPALILRNPVVADLVDALANSTHNRETSFVQDAMQLVQAYSQRFKILICRELDIKSHRIEYIAPCTSLQQGMLSRSMTNEDEVYFNVFIMELTEEGSLDRLRQSWDKLVETHAIFRTVFINSPEGYIQAAIKHKKAPWINLSYTEEKRVSDIFENEKRQWIARNQPSVKSPIQFVSVSAPNVRKVAVYICHALYDGNSFDHMLSELLYIYESRDITPGPSFVDALTHGPFWRYEFARQFWVEHLRQWRFTPLPAIKNEDTSPSTYNITIQSDKLEILRREQSVTLQSVLLALWSYTLQNFTSQPIATGVIVAGRAMNLSEVDKTIGPLFNTLPFFSGHLQGKALSFLIRHCHEFNTSVLPFQHVSLQDIQKWCSRGQPLFDNLFVFQMEPKEKADNKYWKVEDASLSADFPLAFEATKLVNGDIFLRLVAKNTFADNAKLRLILEQFESCVNTIQSKDELAFGPGYSACLEQVEMDLSKTNPHLAPSDSFEWTDVSLAIREEVALITEYAETSISSGSSILELGLDSVEVIKLSAKLRKRGLAVSASKIMRLRTIALISESTSEMLPQRAVNGSSRKHFDEITQLLTTYVDNHALKMREIEAVLPPTALQESMIAGMVQSDFTWYFNHDLLEICNGVDISRLEKAWAELFQNSPILRTGFLEIGDEALDMAYCQLVFQQDSTAIYHASIESFDEIQGVMERAKFRVTKGNLIRNLCQITFVSMNTRQFVLLSMAHALYDGWSLSLMYQDLRAAYDGTLQQRPSVDSYLSSLLENPVDVASKYWGEYLNGAPSCQLQSTPSSTSSRVGVFKAELKSAVKTADINFLSRREQISLQAIFQACWAVVLAHRTKCLEVVFGVVVSGREHDGADELLFPTMNTVALRCILHGTSLTFLRYVEEMMQDIREFQMLPLRKAMAAAQIQGQLFNSLFLLQISTKENEEQRLLRSVDGSSSVDYPVCIEAESIEDGLFWRIACHSAYFSEEYTNDMIKEVDEVLQYLTNPKSLAITHFEGRKVSLCGLPAIEIWDTTTTEDQEQPTHQSDDIQQWNETCSTIQKVLSRVSGVSQESIGPSVTLYHLGLDSISAIKVSTVLRKMAVHIHPRDLLRALSIPEMAQFVATSTKIDDMPELQPQFWQVPMTIDSNQLLGQVGFVQDDFESILPALPMQVYMISIWKNSRGNVFHPEFQYLVAKQMNEDQIFSAWDMFVQKLPILRTSFIATGDTDVPFLQAIHKTAPSATNPNCPPPLVQLTVKPNTADKSLILGLKIHHALYDGVSLPAIIGAFSALLSNKASHPTYGLSQWTQHVIGQSYTDKRRPREEFWTNYLQGCASLPYNAAATQPTQVITENRLSHVQRKAIRNICSLKTAARDHSVSVQSLFFAAYAKAIAHENTTTTKGSKTIVFGIYLANRAYNTALPVTYPTLNLVPLKVVLNDADALPRVAQAIQHDLHEISADTRADVGLWEIVRWTGVKPSAFVNFLSLPDADDVPASDDAVLQHREVETRLFQSDGEALDQVLSHPWISNNAVADAFPDPIDVETSVSGQSLDIGVFGSRHILSDDGAVDLVARIVQHLETASQAE